MKKRKGVCVRWGGRGFGFIQDLETQVEYFCHISCVENRIGLAPGTQVEFEIAAFSSKSGAPVAVFVKLLPQTGGAQ